MSISFKKRVLEIVKQIPIGQTMTYGQVAHLAGNSRAARSVGMVLSKNFDPAVPCYRVIKANGDIGGYNRGKENKRKLLEVEKAQLLKSLHN